MRTRSLAALAVGAVLATACAKVPYTGRRQFNLVPDAIMNGLGKQSYASMLGGAQVKKSGRESEVLTQVGRRISRVANKPDYDWQFSMIDDATINAWCLPGGYIGFYTGILPVLQNEAGMAFVMGHEVGHATARHGAERLSQNLALMGGLAGLELYLAGKEKMTPEQRGIVLGALGIGAQVGVMLPFSRAHESEADVIGVMYMANAGYPPAESLDVWDRMAAQTGGQPPAFLSTHPSHEKRKQVIREWLPQARKRYERNKLPGDTRATLWGR
ncbi:MAG: M48 family peptidase [Deltaproteobacteria bacterium]|nr:MAG: M48 family peptidase [Deltaproteobacteria bacterium]